MYVNEEPSTDISGLREVELDIHLQLDQPLSVTLKPAGQRAGIEFNVPSLQKNVSVATFLDGMPFKIQIPCDYQGPIQIMRQGSQVIEFKVAALGATSDTCEPVKFTLHAPKPRGDDFVRAWLESNKTAPYVAQDATRVAESARTQWIRQYVEPMHSSQEAYIHAASAPPITLIEGKNDINLMGDSAREWFMKQVYGTDLPEIAQGIYKSKDLLKDFEARFYLKKKGGRYYIIFRGKPSLRRHLTGTRYRISHPKVVSLTGGAPSFSSLNPVSINNLKGSAFTLFFVGVMDVAEWVSQENDELDSLAELLGQIGMDSAKILLGTAISAGIVAAAVGLAALAGVTAPVWAVVFGAIAVGVVVGAGLDWVDEELGITRSVKGTLDREYQKFIYIFQRGIIDTERWLKSGYGRFPVMR